MQLAPDLAEMGVPGACSMSGVRSSTQRCSWHREAPGLEWSGAFSWPAPGDSLESRRGRFIPALVLKCD